MVDRFNPVYVKNLPDAYCKTPNSNNAKILEIEQDAMLKLRAAIAEVDASLDIDNATGATLDLYGEMLGQKRGIASDAQYRVMLRNRIMRNLCNGDHDSIVQAISMVFDCDPSEILLVESEDAPSVEIKGLPYVAINESGLTAEDAIKIIHDLVPAGVSAEAVVFDGTFEFGAEDAELDAAKGFADVEQTTGGYFGLLAGGVSSDLPI